MLQGTMPRDAAFTQALCADVQAHAIVEGALAPEAGLGTNGA